MYTNKAIFLYFNQGGLAGEDLGAWIWPHAVCGAHERIKKLSILLTASILEMKLHVRRTHLLTSECKVWKSRTISQLVGQIIYELKVRGMKQISSSGI